MRCIHIWNVLSYIIRIHEYNFGNGFYDNCKLDPSKCDTIVAYMESIGKNEISHLPDSEFKRAHIFREANLVADALSKPS